MGHSFLISTLPPFERIAMRSNPQRALFRTSAWSQTLRLATAAGFLVVGIFGLPPAWGFDGVKPEEADDSGVDFSRDIRPILSNTCFACHGPDEAQRQAGLRLDTPEGAVLKLESGSTAIVPGKLDASAVYQRITSKDPDLRMPPPDQERQLTSQQIEAIGQWISSGASWQQHWSFVPPQRPALPKVAGEELQNPVDHFIRARLQREKIQPAPEADKVTLIRRVTLDLTGLPPTPAEVDQFLADQSPDAYEHLVDRLLGSPRYGEQMARYWLDAARYGDTHGLHLDNERSLWPYREWVIEAFNNNKPFDAFTVEQLAGDLLENPTLEQRVATGFNRCNVTTSEGGSIAEEYRVRYAVDRVETTATVWMGLTAGCAVCHDHKFDPISQREFYQLFAFFNNVTENPMDGNALLPPPTIKLPSKEQNEQIEKLNSEIAAANKKISEQLAKIEYQDPQAVADADDPKKESSKGGKKKARPREEIVWIDDALPAGAKKQGNWNFVTAPDFPVYSGKNASRETGTGMTQHFFTNATAPLKVGANDVLFAYVHLDLLDPPKQIMLQFNDGTWEHRAYWGEDRITFGTPGTAGRLSAGKLPDLDTWVRLEVKAADVGLPAGSTINGWAFTQFGGTVTWDKAGIVTSTPQDGEVPQLSLIAWEPTAKKDLRNLPGPVQNALKIKPEERKPAQQRELLHYFLQHVYTPLREEFAPFNQEQKRLTDALAAELIRPMTWSSRTSRWRSCPRSRRTSISSSVPSMAAISPRKRMLPSRSKSCPSIPTTSLVPQDSARTVSCSRRLFIYLTIRFENLDAATAPAQTVTITQQLDNDLNFSTFDFEGFGFGGQSYSVVGTQSSFETRIDLRDSHGVFLDVAGNLDVNSGLLTFTFTSLDPTTFDLPLDPIVISAAEQDGLEGEGFIRYRIKHNPGLSSGTRIDAQASIVFDTNAAIDTPPIVNTIDDIAPTSQVALLPAVQNRREFSVSWQGLDNVGGAGVVTFDIYVSTDGGEFVLWQAATLATSGGFQGDFGSAYSFFSLARDGAGNLQSMPGSLVTTSLELADGDFDNDGDYDLDDIDALMAEIAAGTHAASFDLTGEALVNLDDRDEWLRQAGEFNLGPGLTYLLGDANLSGAVDVSDFNIWNSNKFTVQSAWSRGNFNEDGNVDVADFNSWNANKFMAAGSAAGGQVLNDSSVERPARRVADWRAVGPGTTSHSSGGCLRNVRPTTPRPELRCELSRCKLIALASRASGQFLTGNLVEVVLFPFLI